MICAYLKNATAQQVFDIVATHLLTQMERAVIGKKGVSACQYRGGKCQYRAGKLSCAGGCLIPDEEYDKNLLENKDWGQLVRASIVPKNYSWLIVRLQLLHDNYLPPLWKERLKMLAEREGLEFGDALQQLPITKESP